MLQDRDLAFFNMEGDSAEMYVKDYDVSAWVLCIKMINQ